MKASIILLSIMFFVSSKAQTKFFTREVGSNSTYRFLVYPLQNFNNFLAISNTSNNQRYSVDLSIYNSVGQLKTNLNLDSNKSYPIINYRIHTLKFISKPKFWIPTYKSYGTFYKYTPCFVIIDTNGNKQVFDYLYSKPTKFEFHDYSPNAFIYTIGETNRDTLNNQYRDSECAVMKIDTQGNEVWRYTINTSSYANIPGGVVATADSGCLVVYYYGPWPAYSQCRATKLNKNGQFEWVKNVDLGTNGLWEVKVIDYRDADQSLYLQYEPYGGAGYIYLPSKICKLDGNMNKVWDVRSGIYDSIKVLAASGMPGDSTYTYMQRAYVGYIRAQNGQDLIGAGADDRDTASTFQTLRGAAYIQYMNDSGRVVWDANYNGIYHGTKKVTGGYNFTGINTTTDGGYILSGSCLDSIGNQVGFLMKIDSLGCLTPDSCETRFISSIRYYNQPATSLSIYPNPASDRLQLNLQGFGNLEGLEISFYNLLGQKTHLQKITQAETSLSVSQWQRGIYLFRLEQQGRNLRSGRLVVK